MKYHVRMSKMDNELTEAGKWWMEGTDEKQYVERMYEERECL